MAVVDVVVAHEIRCPDVGVLPKNRSEAWDLEIPILGGQSMAEALECCAVGVTNFGTMSALQNARIVPILKRQCPRQV